jgi:hypothetical protein
MIRFLLKVLFFLIILTIFIVGLSVFSSKLVERQGFTNDTTDKSNLLFMDSREDFDLMFMGISHARNFSRHNNHQLVSSILRKRIINIGLGNATCGTNDQLFYLEHFYNNENSVDTIIYILSPPLMFSNHLNQASNTFFYEPIKLAFIINYMLFDLGENKLERLLHYIKSKFSPYWLQHTPKKELHKVEYLDSLNMKKVQTGHDIAYRNGKDLNILERNCMIIQKTIEVAHNNNSAILFVIPPALFGKWNGHELIIEFAEKMKKNYNINYYDFSETMIESRHYYDHHHLNSVGVKVFTEEMLLPILSTKI